MTLLAAPLLLLLFPTAEPDQAAARNKGAKQVRAGIQTPGIQIPLSKVTPEAVIAVPGLSGPLVTGRTLMAPQRSQNALLRIDPKENKAASPIGGLPEPCGVPVAAFRSLWTPLCRERGLARLDPESGKVIATVPLPDGSGPPAVAATADSIWILGNAKTDLLRIDPAANGIVAVIRLPAACNSIIFAESAVWVSCPSDNKVLRVEPKTNLIDKQVKVAEGPIALAAGGGSVWALCRTKGQVARIDAKTSDVKATIDLQIPGAEGAIEFGEGSLWVSAQGFPLTRIDPSGAKVVQQFFGDFHGSLRAAQGSIWLSDTGNGRLYRFDPKRLALAIAD